MNLIIQTVMFLLGMGLCVQWVAALFGLVDGRYASQRLYPWVVGNIALWTGVLALAALLAGSAYRPAFLWGVAVFPVFHAAAFAGGNAMMAIKEKNQP